MSLISVGHGASELAEAMGVPEPDMVKSATLRVSVGEIATLTVERFADVSKVRTLLERYAVTGPLADGGEETQGIR